MVLNGELLLNLGKFVGLPILAMLGSLMIWKYYGLPKVANYVNEMGRKAFLESLQKAANDPESEERKILQNVLAASFEILDAQLEQLMTYKTEVTDEKGNVIKVSALPPGLKALFGRAEAHFTNSFANNLNAMTRKFNSSAGTNSPLGLIGNLFGGSGDQSSGKMDIGSLIQGFMGMAQAGSQEQPQAPETGWPEP